jgi:hypothetical protein
MASPIICSVCDTEFPPASPLPAMTFNIGANTQNPKVKSDYAHQVTPYNVDKTYVICFPCFFKALGIKP